MPNFIALGYISILVSNLPGRRKLVLVLMSNVLLDRNFDFCDGCLVVTARYLVVTACYLVVTARSHF